MDFGAPIYLVVGLGYWWALIRRTTQYALTAGKDINQVPTDHRHLNSNKYILFTTISIDRHSFLSATSQTSSVCTRILQTGRSDHV